MEQHLSVLYSAHASAERLLKQAEQYRKVREARQAQAGSRLSLKQHFGLQLIALGRKLAQDNQPAFVE